MASPGACSMKARPVLDRINPDEGVGAGTAGAVSPAVASR